jgi:hypothetical protein
MERPTRLCHPGQELKIFQGRGRIRSTLPDHLSIQGPVAIQENGRLAWSPGVPSEDMKMQKEKNQQG